MAAILDVAAYILQQNGTMTTAKLHKLCYYCQGHHLAWDGAELFDSSIEAWATGPVCPDLWVCHQGLFQLPPGQIPGEPDLITGPEKRTISAVLATYGHLTGRELSLMTHHERPFIKARGHFRHNNRKLAQIDHQVMREFFQDRVH
ncbi:MAG: DUF4065 domain-containing protein [Micrococcales bacterium]|nr:DUF4065 domain-containing protein [Micrococcales bacterium]